MMVGTQLLGEIFISTPLTFGKSFVTGILVSAPVGPIALIALRRVLQGHILLALMVGLGSAIADTLLGSIALIGLDALDLFLKTAQSWIQPAGGTLLILIGIVLWQHPLPQKMAPMKTKKPIRSLATGFFLTILNPITIAAFLGLFSAFHLKTANLPFYIVAITIIGIFAGSLAWWSGLSFSFYWMRRRFGLVDIKVLNKGISLILILLGLYTLWYFLA